MRRLYCPMMVYTRGRFWTEAAVLVENGVIQEVAPRIELEPRVDARERVDWSDLLLVPGTVNAHNHSFQSLLRGIAVDVPFLQWRDEALYCFSPHLDPEAIYYGALLAFGEMMRYGVTTVCDFFYVHQDGLECDEAVIRAAQDLGIRLVLARTLYDWPGAPAGYREPVDLAVARTRHLAAKYQGNPLVRVIPAPHSLHGASPEMVMAGHRLAEELECRFHIHVSEEPFEVEQVQAEHGLRPVEFLDRLGVLDDKLVAIHAVWLDDGEIARMGEKGAHLVYCPSSNMFLADGVTKIPRLLTAGVAVALGTDGACSNNRTSVFEEMRMTALLQKVSTLDAGAVSAKQAFSMGTEVGGEVLELPVGRIEPGYAADFVGIDPGDWSMQPFHAGTDVVAQIVYAMQPQAIRRVVIAGEERVRDGSIAGLSRGGVVRNISAVMDRLHRLASKKTNT
ncbi:amidohydrolase family protein [Kyrpidia spormannii]|uniref:Amidohydrolase n=2 Tax=Kyrpidia spormannii TaxID=2055160 RepID=A0ACA8Z526_9BACL|nr:amidohydrolase [Kyrpidia spormannii]CAB3389616.1 Amidohydrolase [Kyrpidia spormannii]CAB3390517.1 Amidohydrolase [Kyrpidia spormannii]